MIYKIPRYKLYDQNGSFVKEVDYYPNFHNGIIEDIIRKTFSYKKGKRYHRVDGPAYIENDYIQEWWVDGMLHRIGGPAAIYRDLGERWWINGKEVTKEQHDLLFDLIKLKGLL